MGKEIGKLITEARNPRTMNLDQMTSKDAARVIMEEERRAVEACVAASDQLADAIDLYVETLKGPGRILQVGSGCSGDYVQTDVLELEATFGQRALGYKDDKVMALHVQKGWYFFPPEGEKLIDDWAKEFKQRDTSEDSLTQPIQDLVDFNFGKDDLLIVISASGRSPYVVAMAKEAKKRGGRVISLVMNKDTEIKQYSDVIVEAVVGQPPLTGSGRTLAGTASKILMTTLSTAGHAQIGAVYSNLMVNLNVKKWLDNSKFIDRATRIIQDVTEVSYEDARAKLEASDWHIKTACVMIKKNLGREEAIKLLDQAQGVLRKVIG